MTRLAMMARAALSDPVILGALGLVLLARSMDGLLTRAQEVHDRLGDVQVRAEQVLSNGQRAGVAAGEGQAAAERPAGVPET